MDGGSPASQGWGFLCSPCSAGSGQAHPSISLQRWRVAKPFAGSCLQERPPTASPAVIAASAFQLCHLFSRIQKHLPGTFLLSQRLDPPRWLEAKGDRGTPSPHLPHGSHMSRSLFPVLRALQPARGTTLPMATAQPPRGAGSTARPTGGGSGFGEGWRGGNHSPACLATTAPLPAP